MFIEFFIKLFVIRISTTKFNLCFSDSRNVVFFTVQTDDVKASADAVCRLTDSKSGSCRVVAATFSGNGVSILENRENSL